jgi:hypothetical protein
MTRAGDLRLTEDQLLARKELQSKVSANGNLLRQQINQTFSTAEGKRTLKWIMNLCGHHTTGMAFDASGEILPTATAANAAQRAIYLNLRQHIDPSTLAWVENEIG